MKGNINVQTENIFPVIKKFLYSDHEIFLRELVSNATDATQKLKALVSMGQANVELGDLTINVKIEKGKLIISDDKILIVFIIDLYLYLNLNVNKLHYIIDEIFVHYNIANIQLFP